jgi:hypothetical protein
MRLTKSRIRDEIKKVIARSEDGQFEPVDLSLAGVNKWRESMGLEPLAKLPSQRGDEEGGER